MKPKSAAHVHAEIGWTAAAIVMAPGRYAFPNNDTARMRAGMAQDLDVVRQWRRAGHVQEARIRLGFARDARIFLTRYQAGRPA